MKKLTSILLLSGSVLANPAQQEQQLNMMLAMMESTGELDRVSQCISLPQQQLKQIFRQTFTDCGLGDMMADEPDPSHEACIEQSLIRHSGLPASRWQECEMSDDAEDSDPLLAELDALYDSIGERDPTAAEQQQIEQLIANMQQRNVARMEQMVNGLVAGSQGSESSITLPLYPQADLLINIPAQGEIEVGGQAYQTLPGASFISTDSPQQVLAFYRQQLSEYQQHRPSLASKGEIALMQNVPAGFDYSRDMGLAFSIAHIYIQPASAAEQKRLPGAKTLFFIYYPPAF